MMTLKQSSTDPTRIIVFFSQLSRSGKPTACVNVAPALDQVCRRVLIVDADDQAEALLASGVMVSFVALPTRPIRGCLPKRSQ